jgi:hypothetical protein
MRRLYVLPQSVCFSQIQIGVHGSDTSAQTIMNGVLQTTVVPAGTPIMIEMHRMFSPMIGWHYIDLPHGLVLLCTSFAHSELAEDLFHGHPDVAILPHPVLDGKKMLKDHVQAGNASSGNKSATAGPDYKFRQAHLDALKGHATLGATDTDTVIDIARKASAIHPEIKFRNVL